MHDKLINVLLRLQNVSAVIFGEFRDLILNFSWAMVCATLV